MLREEGAPRSHLCAHALGAGCNVAATVAKAGAAVSACEAVGGATPATTAVPGTAPLEKAAAA